MTKLIVTGGSGLIGGEVIRQVLSNPTITHVYALVRKPLSTPWSSHEKLTILIVKDWMNLDDVVQQCEGANACIWALGIKSLANLTMEEARHVSIDYTMHAASVLTQELAQPGKPFRFAYLSGVMAEKDQEKSLWFMGEARRMRGEVENQLLKYAATRQTKQDFELMVARPAFVLAEGAGISMQIIGAVLGEIQVTKLAETLIEFTLKGSNKHIWENADLKRGL